MECFICNNNTTNDKVTLKCGHTLHYNCMINYLRVTYYGIDKHQIVCFICRDKTVMHEIPAPDIVDNDKRYKMLVGELNPCKMGECTETEVIGNEGYCNVHNQRSAIYTGEMYDLAFYWIYTICKQSIAYRKRGFFDVILKLIKKHSFSNCDQITDHILASLGNDKYNTKTLYQKSGVIQDTLLESTVE